MRGETLLQDIAATIAQEFGPVQDRSEYNLRFPKSDPTQNVSNGSKDSPILQI